MPRETRARSKHRAGKQRRLTVSAPRDAFTAHRRGKHLSAPGGNERYDSGDDWRGVTPV